MGNNAVETITVSREQFAQAAVIFDMMQAARENRAILPEMGGLLSYVPRQPRVYMDPRAAQILARELGPTAAREFLGGHAYRDWMILSQQPTSSDVHVDAILTNMSVAYRNAEYIGPLCAPRVQVTKRSDKFFVFDTQNLRRQNQLQRAPGAQAGRSGYNVSTDNYSVETYTQEHPVPVEVRDNADNPLDPDRDGVNFVADIIDLEYEEQAEDLLHTSGNWTTNATLAGTSQWSDYLNSDPFTDLSTARSTVLKQITRRANTLQMSYEVFEKLALHPDLLDRVKYTGTGDRPAMVTAQMMAALFMVEVVAVGSAVKNSAKEGQTDSMAFLWGKHAWLGFVPAAPAINTPAAGYAFTTGRVADRYYEPQTKSDIIRLEEAWHMKKVAAGAGYRLVNAIA